MLENFAHDEYNVIDADSPEFASYADRDAVDGVPFVIIRDSAGRAGFAKAGIVGAEEMRSFIARHSARQPFNLRKSK